MKRLFLIFTILCCITMANAQNPFEAYGYTPKIATLSNGKYNEFHDLDTIVQIGTVLFNTQSKQIVAFVQVDTMYSEATLQADIVSMWISPDPLSDEYPSWSPYAYCRDNPVRLVDPTGMFDIETGTIEKGDNLNKIKNQINQKYGTKLSVSDIAKGNNIANPNKIKVGDKIALPGQNAELKFDLKELKVTDATYNIDMPGLSWEGTSGRDGYQSSEFQDVENKGPIPEGSYMVDPSNTQKYTPATSLFGKALEKIGVTNWEGTKTLGGTDDWGNIRTWLTPMEGTKTYGRKGFSIHGGKTLGSAGCIDLTKNNNSFHNWFKSYGKPIKLNVKY